MTTHYIAGAGLHGYLYNSGPEIFDTYEAAVDFLADLHELGRRRRNQLAKTGYLELELRRDGNEYCEIEECDCSDPDHDTKEENDNEGL